MVISPIVEESLQMLGKLVKQARREAKLTMTALAQRAGIERKTIARLEKGDASISLGIFLTVIWLLDIPLLKGLDIGNRQSRKQLSLLLNVLGETQDLKKPRRKKDDHF